MFTQGELPSCRWGTQAGHRSLRSSSTAWPSGAQLTDAALGVAEGAQCEGGRGQGHLEDVAQACATFVEGDRSEHCSELIPRKLGRDSWDRTELFAFQPH